MNKNSHIGLTYFAANLLAVLRIIILFGLPMLLLLFKGETILRAVFGEPLSVIDWIEIGATVILWGICYLPGQKLDRRMMDMRNERDFDERGLNKNYNEYQKLSKAERIAIDKQRLADMERILGTGTMKRITKAGSAAPEENMKRLQGLSEVSKR